MANKPMDERDYRRAPDATLLRLMDEALRAGDSRAAAIIEKVQMERESGR